MEIDDFFFPLGSLINRGGNRPFPSAQGKPGTGGILQRPRRAKFGALAPLPLLPPFRRRRHGLTPAHGQATAEGRPMPGETPPAKPRGTVAAISGGRGGGGDTPRPDSP